MIRWRLPRIVDRDLRSLLYRIYKDEAKHLSIARKEISTFVGKRQQPSTTLLKRASLLFPFEIAKCIASREELANVKSMSKALVSALIKKVRDDSPYRPVDTIARFDSLPGYRCFGCSPHRPDGLHLEPKKDDSNNSVFDLFKWSRRHEGFHGIVHGGLIIAALDELMGYACIILRNGLPVTRDLQVSFNRPVYIDRQYELRASILSDNGPNIRVISKILNGPDQTLVSAEGTFRVLDKSMAGRLFPEIASHPSLETLFWPNSR